MIRRSILSRYINAVKGFCSTDGRQTRRQGCGMGIGAVLSEEVVLLVVAAAVVVMVGVVGAGGGGSLLLRPSWGALGFATCRGMEYRMPPIDR